MAIKGGNKMKPLKITIPGNPVTKKNHSDFVTIPIKGSTRCPACKKFHKTMTRLFPSHDKFILYIRQKLLDIYP